jgi:hypothetical protein
MNNRKKIYVCSPYRGQNEREVADNVACALKYCRFVITLDCIPVCPHIYLTRFLDDNSAREREIGLKIGIELLGECAEVWTFEGSLGGKSNISEGMRAEIAEANRLGIPVKHIDLYDG